MIDEAINEFKKYTLGRKNTEKVEISVLQINRVIKTLEEEPCEDAISRQAVLDMIENAQIITDGEFCGYCTEDIDINILPHVAPQPKTGRWIKSTGYDDRDHFYTCSECGRHINLICGAKLADYPYCHCGTKMEEVEENDD